MDASEIIRIARIHLGDGSASVFPDRMMERWLARAVSIYYADTGFGVGEAPLCVDGSGEGEFPSDYIGSISAYDREGISVGLSSAHVASEDFGAFATQGESGMTLYRDHSEDGKYRLLPVPRQEVEQRLFEEEGAYGIVTQMYGTIGGEAPGGTTSFFQMDDIGSLRYRRQGSLDEVNDFLALVYAVVGQAYAADTDLASEKLADAYASMYRERVSLRRRLGKGSAFAPRLGNYF